MSIRFVQWTCCLAALVAVVSCGRKLGLDQALNRAPEVVFDAASVPVSVGENVTHRVSWTGTDLDGRVVGYQIAVNPRSLTDFAGWKSTSERSHALAVRRAAPMGARLVTGFDRDFDVIAVRAQDDRGAWSEAITRAFFDENVAPTVRITVPQPSALITPILPSTFTLRWQGEDPDGASGRPVAYQWILIPSTDSDYFQFISEPDSLRRRDAPGFPGWNTLPADSTSLTLSGLLPFTQYLFVITAIDDQGAYDPIFSLSKNMLNFRVGFPIGPRITAFNNFFEHTFPAGFVPAPANEFAIDLPTRGDVTIQWFAVPPAGLDVAGYRWSVDIEDLYDETPRQNQNDLAHWSEWALNTTSVTLRFRDEDLLVPHRLSIEARDNLGVVSLAMIVLRPVVPTFEKPLLIVDDTRLRPDQFQGGVLRPPLANWPNAAELDTFLYARGGFPWRGYPAGTLSPTGIFDGYDFDTLGTRSGSNDLTVPLATLSRYRQVIWIVDALGATFDAAGANASNPMTALRYMTAPGRQNTLAAYLAQGGKAWILGGGAGDASTREWDRGFNNIPTRTYSSLSSPSDLGPGRFMFDHPHWRSEFRIATVPSPIVEKSPFPIAEYHPAPRYELFPAALQLRSAATDPVPPLRTSPSFYPITLPLEFLQQPNAILEDQVPSVPVERVESKLDTIYVARAQGLPPTFPNAGVTRQVTPVMTYYHGDDDGSVLFSGFDLWSFRRTQCVALVDAVLQGVWKLTKTGGGTIAEDQTDTRRASSRGKK